MSQPAEPALATLGGSAAGHNGLKDIHAMLGTPDFWRLRLGIGHPGVKAEVVDYVLRKPSPDHRDAIEACIERTLKSRDELLAGNMDKAMQIIHAGVQRPKPPRPPQPPRLPAGEPGHQAPAASHAGLPATEPKIVGPST
jgi:PTH1 family peptidyl-tRNA hydrolase